MTKQIDWIAEAKKSWKLGYEQGRAEVLEEIRGKIEEMKEVTWIDHGRDCKEGLRPCGAVVHPEHNADRCSVESYDKKTLSGTLAVVDEIKNKEGV